MSRQMPLVGQFIASYMGTVGVQHELMFHTPTYLTYGEGFLASHARASHEDG